MKLLTHPSGLCCKKVHLKRSVLFAWRLSPTIMVILGSTAQQIRDFELETCMALPPENVSQLVLYYACVNFTAKQIIGFFGICCVTRMNSCIDIKRIIRNKEQLQCPAYTTLETF